MDALGRRRARASDGDIRYCMRRYVQYITCSACETSDSRRSTVTQRGHKTGQEGRRAGSAVGPSEGKRRAGEGWRRVPEERRKGAGPGIGHKGAGCGDATPAVRPEAGRFTCQALRSRRGPELEHFEQWNWSVFPLETSCHAGTHPSLVAPPHPITCPFHFRHPHSSFCTPRLPL